MDASLPLIIFAWMWVAVGAALFGIFCYIVLKREDDADFVGNLGVFLIGMGGSGLVVLALAMLGFSRVSLWAWRVLGILQLAGFALMNFNKKMSRSLRLMVIGDTVIGVLFVVGAFLSPSALPQLAQAAHPTGGTNLFINAVQFWHDATLFILGAGTVAFLVLFIFMLQRGISPQFESHWGGIGGGLGGWRMSPSLTYLVAATVLGVLFMVFVMRFEPPPPPPGSPSAAPPGITTPAKSAQGN